MDIPESNILESIVDTVEKMILPELQTNHSKGQAMAIMLLLKGLAAKREIKQKVLETDVISLRELFQDILQSLEIVDEYAQDGHLTELKRKIRFALSQGHNGSQAHKLEEEDGRLNDLLESAILALAEGEKNHEGPSLDGLIEIRRKIRRFLKAQFEVRKKLTGKIEIGLLSKV